MKPEWTVWVEQTILDLKSNSTGRSVHESNQIYLLVDIASMLQYDLRSIHQYIRPDLEALIPELRTSALDIGEEIPKLLDSLVS